MRPVIVLTFANAVEQQHLPLLKEESRRIERALQPLHDREAIEVYRVESTSTEDIVRIIKRFEDRLFILYYGGHAGSEELHLEGGAAQGSGLADMIREKAPNLKLVFLNGCSTKGQVEELLAAGVGAVIATDVPIADDAAKVFAQSFFDVLSQRDSIEKAFNFAAGELKTYRGTAGPQPKVHLVRGARLSAPGAERFPWGIYLKETEKKILKWKLPLTPGQRRLRVGSAITAAIAALILALKLFTAGAVIQGQIIDAETREPIDSVYVEWRDGDRATYTDAEGYFRLKVPGRESSRVVSVKKKGYIDNVTEVPSFGTDYEITIAKPPEQ